MPMEARDHAHTGQAALGRLGLQDAGHAAFDAQRQAFKHRHSFPDKR